MNERMYMYANVCMCMYSYVNTYVYVCICIQAEYVKVYTEYLLTNQQRNYFANSQRQDMVEQYHEISNHKKKMTKTLEPQGQRQCGA